MRTEMILNGGVPFSQNSTMSFELLKNGGHKYLLHHRKRKRNVL